MRGEPGVAGGWEPSRARSLGWAESGTEPSRVEPSRARSLGRTKPGAEPRQEPSQEPRAESREPRVESREPRAEPRAESRRLGPGGFVRGIGLELLGVVVAIGCIVYECLEHEVDSYAAVMFSYRVYTLCVTKSVW